MTGIILQAWIINSSNLWMTSKRLRKLQRIFTRSPDAKFESLDPSAQHISGAWIQSGPNQNGQLSNSINVFIRSRYRTSCKIRVTAEIFGRAVHYAVESII